MSLYDAFGTQNKHNAMLDTWGHLYPDNNSTHKGVIVVATGGGSFNVLDRHFETCECSPIEYELVYNVDKFIDESIDWDVCQLLKINCELVFSGESQEMYLGSNIGHINIISIETVGKVDL